METGGSDNQFAYSHRSCAQDEKIDKGDQTVQFLEKNKPVKDGIRFCRSVVILSHRSQERLDMLAMVDAILSPCRCSPFHIDPLLPQHQKRWCNETAK